MDLSQKQKLTSQTVPQNRAFGELTNIPLTSSLNQTTSQTKQAEKDLKKILKDLNHEISPRKDCHTHPTHSPQKSPRKLSKSRSETPSKRRKIADQRDVIYSPQKDSPHKRREPRPSAEKNSTTTTTAATTTTTRSRSPDITVPAHSPRADGDVAKERSTTPHKPFLSFGIDNILRKDNKDGSLRRPWCQSSRVGGEPRASFHSLMEWYQLRQLTSPATDQWPSRGELQPLDLRAPRSTERGLDTTQPQGPVPGQRQESDRVTPGQGTSFSHFSQKTPLSQSPTSLFTHLRVKSDVEPFTVPKCVFPPPLQSAFPFDHTLLSRLQSVSTEGLPCYPAYATSSYGLHPPGFVPPTFASPQPSTYGPSTGNGHQPSRNGYQLSRNEHQPSRNGHQPSRNGQQSSGSGHQPDRLSMDSRVWHPPRPNKGNVPEGGDAQPPVGGSRSHRPTVTSPGISLTPPSSAASGSKAEPKKKRQKSSEAKARMLMLCAKAQRRIEDSKLQTNGQANLTIHEKVMAILEKCVRIQKRVQPVNEGFAFKYPWWDDPAQNVHVRQEKQPDGGTKAVFYVGEEVLKYNDRRSANRSMRRQKKYCPYICIFCGQKYADATDVSRHVRTHTHVLPFRCDVDGCGEAFTQNVSLESHQNKKHDIVLPAKNSKRDVRYICEFTGRVFDTVAKYMDHAKDGCGDHLNLEQRARDRRIMKTT